MSSDSRPKSVGVFIRLAFVSLLSMTVAAGAGEREAGKMEVNVQGKDRTWYGTASGEEIGSVLDAIVLPPDKDPNEFLAHGGSIEGGTVKFTLRTTRGGRLIFTYMALLDQQDSVRAKYKAGEKWVQLPPGRIQADFYYDFDERSFSYWIDIPEAQRATEFELTFKKIVRSRIKRVSIAAPRIDPSLIVSTERHPYLFFSREDLPAIRKRSSEQPIAAFREALRRSAKQLRPESLVEPGGVPPTYNDRVQVIRIAWAALEGLLSEDRQLIDRAKRGLLAVCGWKELGDRVNMSHGGVFRNLAIAYDLIYDDLSPAERERVEAFLARGAAFIYAEASQTVPSYWRRRRGTRCGGNWATTIQSGLGMVAMALRNKHPDAEKWLEEATAGVKETIDYDFGPDGAIHEAFARYGANVTYHSIAAFAGALRRVTGEDLFERNDRVLDKFALFSAYMLYPTLDATLSLGDTAPGTYSVGLPLLVAASEYGNGVAAWYLKALIDSGWSPGSDSPFYGTIWRVAPVKPENPETSPRLSEAFAYNNDDDAKKLDKRTDHGSGHVFLRTGFTSPDDIYFACQAGDNQGFHGHADQGSYVLAAYGTKFLQDLFAGSYDGKQFSYRHSSEAHQTVLVDGAGQGAEVQGLADLDTGYKIASVEALDSHRGYDYLRMNLLQAYRYNPHNRTMRKAMRHVVFVRRTEREGYFVVIDDLQRDDEAHTYSHPFHPWRKVRVMSAEGGRIVLSGSKAKLHIAAVVPKEMAATRHTKFRDSFVLLTHTKPVVRFVMVTVLYPVKGAGAPPAFVPVEEGETVGVVIDGVRIAFDKSTDAVSVSGNLSDVRARLGGRP